MRLSYNKLWKLLIDENLNKSQLQVKAGISPSTMAKLGKGGTVTTDTLIRICIALDCQIGDICELTKEGTADAGRR